MLLARLDSRLPTPQHLWVSVTVFVVLVLAIDTPIFAFGWAADTANTSPLDPPGAVVGAVWVIIFALFGFARWRLTARARRRRDVVARRWLDLLVLACAAYPFYVLLPGSETAALIGNLATIALAGVVAVFARRAQRVTVVAPLAVVMWVTFASIPTAQSLGLL